jgi:hypothetical protein
VPAHNDATGRQYSARRHQRSVPATGIALKRLALGSVDRSVPTRQNERNDRQSRPTLGRALTVTRCWVAAFDATASALGPSDRDCAGAAGARSVDRSVPTRQNERNDRQSRPTLGRALTVTRCWVGVFEATASAFGPSDGDCAEAAGARSVDWSVPARQNDRNGRQSRRTLARSHRYTLVRQYVGATASALGSSDGDCAGAAGARSVDRSVPTRQNERNDRQSRPTLGRAPTVTRWWAAILGATASALGPSDGIVLERLALARSIGACAPGRMSEMVGSRDPPWGALSRCWAATFGDGIGIRAQRRGLR